MPSIGDSATRGLRAPTRSAPTPSNVNLRSAHDVGPVLRQRRLALGLDQASLAERIGVGRQWVVAIESGKPRAEDDLVQRALRVLGLGVSAEPRGNDATIDAILHVPAPSIRLAPHDDVASNLHDDPDEPRRTKLAMRIATTTDATRPPRTTGAAKPTPSPSTRTQSSTRATASAPRSAPSFRPSLQRRHRCLSPAATTMLELALTVRLDALDQRHGSAAPSC